MPAKRTMSSNRAAVSRRDMPRSSALIAMLSRPEISGWKPAPSSSRAASRPGTSTDPDVGRTIPASSLSSVDLPEPLAPTTPSVSPAAMSNDTPESAGTIGSGGAAPAAPDTTADLSDPGPPRRAWRR